MPPRRAASCTWAADKSTDRYAQFHQIVRQLRETRDYEIELKSRSVSLTEEGIDRVEAALSIPDGESIYDERYIELTHHLEQALKAQAVFHRDKDYIVENGEVIIVDEFTGRKMIGRRYSEGLHQAIEAKEGVRVQRQNVTLATITFQNYFRMYEKLSGMTGTAKTAKGNIQVFVPASAAGGRTPPVIVFLHGSGERGDDGAKPTQVGIGPYLRAHLADFPAIVVFPQVPDETEWSDNPGLVFATLDAATREFHGDPDRTYLTGLSMGGYGVWDVAMQAPDRFAALAPVCGAVRQPREERDTLFVAAVARAADPYTAIAQRLRDVPVWIFHGAKDDVVPPADDRLLIAALRAEGAADARYTEFPDANHNSWDPAYSQTPEFWDWLFAQKR